MSVARGLLLCVAVVVCSCIQTAQASAQPASYGTRFCTPVGSGWAQPTSLTAGTGYWGGQAFFVNGSPRFLTLISYFGAMKFGHDPRAVFNQLCSRGINGVRIFAEFWTNDQYCGPRVPRSTPGWPGQQPTPGWAPPNVYYRYEDNAQSGFVPNANAVIKSDGTLNRTPIYDPYVPADMAALSPLDRLKFVLRRAREAGLVVDLSCGHEVVYGRTMAALKTGLEELSYELRGAEFDHVMFDVSNEFNSLPGTSAKCGDLNERLNFRGDIDGLVRAAKQGRPGMGMPGKANRIVFASTAAGVNQDRNGDLNAVYEAAKLYEGGTLTPQVAMAVHEERTSGWSTSNAWLEVQSAIKAKLGDTGRLPIYAQEPCAAHYCVNVPFSAYYLYMSLRNALTKGAAAWVFHTESLFFPANGQSISSPSRTWQTSELDFLVYNPGPQPYNAFSAIEFQCWGGATPGWFPLVMCS